MANYLKRRIMRRIYGIWFVRRALPVGMCSVASIYLALMVTAERFFVAEIMRSFRVVVENNVWGLPKYIEAALNNAEPHVLVLISMTGLVGFILAVKLLRNVRQVVSGVGAVYTASARK